MRRALAILKYLPAVLCGLLVLAWVASVFASAGVSYQLGNGEVILGIIWGGRLDYSYHRPNQPLNRISADWSEPLPDSRYYLGQLAHAASRPPYQFVAGQTYFRRTVFIPIPFLITLLLPLAIAPFIRFRFLLWSYFAWTALVAAELAYYLRA